MALEFVNKTQLSVGVAFFTEKPRDAENCLCGDAVSVKAVQLFHQKTHQPT